MKVSGEHWYPAEPAAAYAAFLDPEAIAAALPGCEELRELTPGTYAVAMAVAIAGLRGRPTGIARIIETDPPRQYRINVEGSGRTAGITAVVVVTFHPERGGASARYAAMVTARGLAGRAALTMANGPVKLLARQFMQNMEEQVRIRRSQ